VYHAIDATATLRVRRVDNRIDRQRDDVRLIARSLVMAGLVHHHDAGSFLPPTRRPGFLKAIANSEFTATTRRKRPKAACPTRGFCAPWAKAASGGAPKSLDVRLPERACAPRFIHLANDISAPMNSPLT
jgi:hypothetical protein